MYLIATDEAGYGPKLGPLVVVATAWKIPAEASGFQSLVRSFNGLSQPCRQGDLTIVIDDSKRVFRQGDGLDVLHTVVSAGLHWCGSSAAGFPDILSYLCPDDVASINRSPWLATGHAVPLVARESIQPLLDLWSASGIELVNVKARVIPARDFNAALQDGSNKADLLSRSTLGLVRDLVEAFPALPRDGAVYCDRHGGRRYYAGPLLHHFPDWLLQVIEESKECSLYRLQLGDACIHVRFTVKGDRFAPVAFSSLFAKYLRERFMLALNAYFLERYIGNDPLKPTAGYPVDADRFLGQIAEIRRREPIVDFDLVRQR